MEKLIPHIEQLLAHHDYVVLPGLGGFVVQTQPARVLPNRISPPKATVAFNPLMVHADGMLSIEVARAEQISYRNASEIADNEIQQAITLLKSGESVSIGNIGSIQQNSTGEIVFTPNENCDFLPQNFLLSALHITPYQTANKQNNKTISFTLNKTNTFRYVAAAMLIFGLFISTNKVNDQKMNTASLNCFSIKPTQKKAVAETKISSVCPSDTTEAKTTHSYDYHIIIASLSSKEDAERYCREWDKDSNELKIIESAKMFRIALESFDSKEKAINKMEKLRQSDAKFENAWVFCNQ